VRPGASVHVDWVLKGTEIGFRYGELGDDIWALLFRHWGPVHLQPRTERFRVSTLRSGALAEIT
jgi:hypothetical protein